MPQIYLFIGALLAILVIMTRRDVIFKREKKKEFKAKISKKVDELKKEEAKQKKVRFKEVHSQERQGAKKNIAALKAEVRKADMAIAKRQWSDAKKILIKATALTDKEAPITIKLAGVYMESGETRKAESLYKKMADAGIENSEIHEKIAKIYSQKKRYKDAVSHYVKAIELDEKDDGKLNELGNLYALMMRYSLAAECYRRAAELKPREINYLFSLAECCKKDDDYDNALYTYEKILTLEPYNEKAKNEAQDVRIRLKQENFLVA